MKMRILSAILVGVGAFRELDFTTPDGQPPETILLAGANGTRKTTLLRIITDIL